MNGICIYLFTNNHNFISYEANTQVYLRSLWSECSAQQCDSDGIVNPTEDWQKVLGIFLGKSWKTKIFNFF